MTKCAECGVIDGGHRQVCSQWVSPSTPTPVEMSPVEYARGFFGATMITYCKRCGNVVAVTDLHTQWHYLKDGYV